MATIVRRLNKAWQTLVGPISKTTQSGRDYEYHSNSLADMMTIDNSRLAKYNDYIWMDDNYGQEITSSLDSVADMVLRIDEPLNDVVTVKSDSEKTSGFVKDLFTYLDLRTKLWTYARSLAKFGDLFTEIIWAKDDRNSRLSHILGLKPLPAATMFLNINEETGEINKEFPYRQEFEGNTIALFRPWQIIHFMLPREPTDDYGTSWLKPARLPHRQLLAMENALVIARLKKTNIRVHKVDVSGKTGDQGEDAVQEYKDQFKKKVWVNPSTGKVEKHKTPVMGNDDVYMGVTKDGGKFAGIELLEGKSEVDITDILYIREKLMVALKTPKHLINITDAGVSNKLVSVDQGLYFSAAIQKVQIALIEGLSHMTDLGLTVKGVNIRKRGEDYTLALPKQRTTDELIAARVELIRSTVAKNYGELGLLTNKEIMRSILGWDAEKIARVQKDIDKVTAQSSDNDAEDKTSKFNKTGRGSAPVRLPQKEEVATVLKDPDVQILMSDLSALMRNKTVFENKAFSNKEQIESIVKNVGRESI